MVNTLGEVTINGLEALLDEDADPPYLELRLHAGTRDFAASILAVENNWALTMREDQGHPMPDGGDLYSTQADAILAALLTALHESYALPAGQRGLGDR
jgi:hypothetical protein